MYLLHPDKIAMIEAVIKNNRASKSKSARVMPSTQNANGVPATGSPLIDSLAQKLFLDRQMKQTGRM